MSKCTKNASIYEDLEKCPGQKKLPGIRDHVYATSKRDILAYPSVPDSPKTLAEAVQTTGDFTLAADKYFYKLGIVKDNGKIEVENQGTDGCKTFLNKTTFAIPGTEEDASGFIDQANNDELIILVPQRNGKYRIIGSEGFRRSCLLSRTQEQQLPTPTQQRSRRQPPTFIRLHSIRVRFTPRMEISTALLVSL